MIIIKTFQLILAYIIRGPFRDHHQNFSTICFLLGHKDLASPICFLLGQLKTTIKTFQLLFVSYGGLLETTNKTSPCLFLIKISVSKKNPTQVHYFPSLQIYPFGLGLRPMSNPVRVRIMLGYMLLELCRL